MEGILNLMYLLDGVYDKSAMCDVPRVRFLPVTFLLRPGLGMQKNVFEDVTVMLVNHRHKDFNP